MRLSEIGNKDIIDLTKGCNHGQLWDCELLFERRSGRIVAILIPAGTFRKKKKGCTDDVMKLRVKKDLSARTTFVIRPCITNAMHIGTPSASVAFSAFKVIDENPNRTSTALYRQR